MIQIVALINGAPWCWGQGYGADWTNLWGLTPTLSEKKDGRPKLLPEWVVLKPLYVCPVIKRCPNSEFIKHHFTAE